MNQLRDHDLKPCSNCGKPHLESGLPLFWTVKVQRHGIDLNACRRLAGLSTMLGSAPLARAMGDGAPLTKPMCEEVTLFLCEPCAMGSVFLPVLMEAAEAKADACGNSRRQVP